MGILLFLKVGGTDAGNRDRWRFVGAAGWRFRSLRVSKRFEILLKALCNMTNSLCSDSVILQSNA